MTQLNVLLNALEQVKGTDIKIFDMRGISSMLDFIMVATVNSKRQGDAVTKYIKDDMHENGFPHPNFEGKSSGWVLVDCKDVVLHVFSEEDRDLYDIDRLWDQIPMIDLDMVRKNEL